jgi:hypothetical protein
VRKKVFPVFKNGHSKLAVRNKKENKETITPDFDILNACHEGHADKFKGFATRCNYVYMKKVHLI